MTDRNGTIIGEPTIRMLRQIFDRSPACSPTGTEEQRRIVIGSSVGTIEYGPGGFGNAAIIATFGELRLIRRERESEDYSRNQNGNAPLELYPWEREDAPGTYYESLSDAQERAR